VLDVRKLLLLRQLQARGTVAAVAEALAYTPSAVSQALAQLQREAGVPLTERVGRRLQLTEAGERLAAHADALLARLEAAEAELQQEAGVVAGRVRLAALQTPLLSLAPPALAALRARHPDLRVELLEAEPEESLPAVALGELDVAVAEEYDHAPRRLAAGLVREELLRDRVVLALPAAHPLARDGAPVPLSALAAERWAAPRLETGFAAMLASACREAGFEPDVPFRANDVQIISRLVAAGHAVALLPTLGAPERHPGLAVGPLAGLDLGRTVSAFARAGPARRPAVRALVAALREAASEWLLPAGSRPG
jgi:DNA-binding transcriptional LysR family regulator